MISHRRGRPQRTIAEAADDLVIVTVVRLGISLRMRASGAEIGIARRVI